MASIRSSDHPLPLSKRRLKPLSLRDYLLDDLSSCSSNGFKSFPRRQSSSTVCLLLDAEIKRSGMFRYNRSLTCGLVFSHAVQKASTMLLSAVKLLSYPSRERDDKSKNAVLSKSFSRRRFWRKSSTRELNVDRKKGRKLEDPEQEIQRLKTFADFLQENQDRVSSCSGEATLSAYESSISSSELITNSEVTQSSSGETETSNENDAVEDAKETGNGVVGDCVGSHVSDGSTLNDNREECVNEEREQLSPISVFECPFEDDAISPLTKTDEEKLIRKGRRFTSLVQLEPVDLEKCIDQYIEREDHDSHMVDTAEDQSENRANHLFGLVKSRLIDEPNHLLASHSIDNLLLDFFKEDGNHEIRDEDKLVKIVEEWVMRRQEEDVFMREKRKIYVKEMKWECINGDEREFVVEELGNGFVSLLIDELVLDLSL